VRLNSSTFNTLYISRQLPSKQSYWHVSVIAITDAILRMNLNMTLVIFIMQLSNVKYYFMSIVLNSIEEYCIAEDIFCLKLLLIY